MSAPASPTDLSTFEGLRDWLYRRLLELVKRNAVNKRFFPCTTGEDVLKAAELGQIFGHVLAADPRIRLSADRFARRIVHRKLQTFLAALIYSRIDIKAVASFTKCLVTPDQWPILKRPGEELGVLPISRDDAKTILNDDIAADAFLQNQDQFCAVIIRQHQEVRCDSGRLLPYLSEKHLGSGAFGIVYKVEIAPSHFISDNGLSNPKKYPMARKDYILKEGTAYVQERDFMREILKNPLTHKNILKNLGSLETESTYSVFMELADYDLWDYMTKHHKAGPSTYKQKADILRCATDLTDALAHLHSDLHTDTFEKLTCFHLDLKPRNILVVTERDQSTGDEVRRWKLSDFNMSKARGKRKQRAPYDNAMQRARTLRDYDFNTLFQRRRPNASDQSQTVQTANPRGDGTYSAPEARVPNGKVQAESDTWSLGCVLCVVFSYLDSGASGVAEFSNLRAKLPRDQFFTVSTGSRARLSEAVERWFKALRSRANRRSREEGAAVSSFLEFLRKKVLVVDPEKRKSTKAKDIVEALGEVYRGYLGLAEKYPDGYQPRPPPSNPNKKTHRRMFSLPFGRRRSPPPQIQVAPPIENKWKIPLPNGMKPSLCQFGPSGEILVFISGSTLVAYSPRDVVDTGDIDLLIEFGSQELELKGHHWNNVAVSSEYIVAASNQSRFDVSHQSSGAHRSRGTVPHI
jgi:serine/threonine protein kinase